jgi:glutamyl-tRNA synthetase
MGGVRTALFNYLYAKKNGGDFLLRIEDTDQTRYVTGAEEYIIEALNWCGIVPDEGVPVGGPHAPYRQSERKGKGIYQQFADRLVESGHAYYAFDTAEELDAMRQRLSAAKVAAPQYNAVVRESMKNSLTLSHDEVKSRIDNGEHYVIRLKVPRNEEIRFEDMIRGWVTFNSSQVDDKVLLKSDGMPTYHLAHIVDDHLMKITHAVRGEEWLPSAPAHILIYRYLGLEDVMPRYAHLPLLLKPDGNGKLSKRDGDRLGFPVFPLNWTDPATGEVSPGYREKGYFPEAFVNMLVLLGWNPGTNQEIFSMDQLIEAFSFERVSKSGAKYDPEKAKWFNQQYLREKPVREVATIFAEELERRGVISEQGFVEKVSDLLREKAHFIHEFWDLGSYFFQRPAVYDEKVISKRWNDDARKFFTGLPDVIRQSGSTAGEMESAFKGYADSVQVKPNSMLQLLRVLITGMPSGPGLFETMALLGNRECAERIESALSDL